MNPIGLGILGSILGFGGGFLTRPTFMGMPIPLGIINSSAPMDAPFRESLITHLGIATAVGCVAGVVLGIIVSRMRKA